MHERFLDRMLHCADCDTDFIFTAGKQFFFFDKQFKNDPKRCKPCKSRRSGLAAQAAGLDTSVRMVPRPETRTQCSACGIETTVPFKPTQGRPVLCRQCFGSKAPVTQMPSQAAAAQVAMTQAAAVQAGRLSELSLEPSGDMLSPDAALLAVTSMTSAKAHSSIATQADVDNAARASDLNVSSEVTLDLRAGSAQAPKSGYPQHPAHAERMPGQDAIATDDAAQA